MTCSCRRLSNVVNIYRRVFLILYFQLKKGKNSCSQEHFMYCRVNVAGPDQEWGVNLQGTQDISNQETLWCLNVSYYCDCCDGCQWKLPFAYVYTINQMFEKGDSSNRQWKQMIAPFSKFCGKMWVGFCLKHLKTLLLGGFILKPIERA